MATKDPPPFDKNFYLPREKEFIKIIQKEVGCFNCNKQGADKTCSACKIATYCSRDCQGQHWKATSIGAKGKEQPHRIVCKAVRSFRNMGSPFPLMLPLVGGISAGMLSSEMNLYSSLFLNSLAKSKIELVDLAVTCTEETFFGDKAVYLTCTAGLLQTPDVIQNVIYQQVDKGEEAVKMLYQDDKSMGVLSKETRLKAVGLIVDFIERLNKKNVAVATLTCARGLTFLPSDKDSRDQCQKANGNREIEWLLSHR